jgi:hypothetical protein
MEKLGSLGRKLPGLGITFFVEFFDMYDIIED